jgi:uncharacterized protein GlcG (DUF336 family)
MSRKWHMLLWLLAGLTAITLAMLTVRLAARARNQTLVNMTVYVADRSGAIGLLERPDAASPVVAALVRGSAVTVLEVNTQQGQTWVRIQKANTVPGWVPLKAVTRDPP